MCMEDTEGTSMQPEKGPNIFDKTNHQKDKMAGYYLERPNQKTKNQDGEEQYTSLSRVHYAPF